MFTYPYVEGWNTFDRATLYSVDTVYDGESSSIVQFSSMEIPEIILWYTIIYQNVLFHFNTMNLNNS